MKKRFNCTVSIFFFLLIITLLSANAHALSASSDCQFILKVSSETDTTPGDTVSVEAGKKVYVDVYISQAKVSAGTTTDTSGVVYGLYAVSFDADKFSIGNTSGTDYIIGANAIAGWSVFDVSITENGATSFVQAKVGDPDYGTIRLTTVGTTEYHMLRYVFTALDTTDIGTYDFEFLKSIGGPTGQLYTQLGTYDFNIFALDGSHNATTFAATAAPEKVGVTVTEKTYAVTYDGNGATGGSVPTDATSPYLGGATVTVLGNTGTLVRTGYTFAGWNTEANGSGTPYAAGDTFQLGFPEGVPVPKPNAPVTLYAQWTEASNSYTVTAAIQGSSSTGVGATIRAYAVADTSFTTVLDSATVAADGTVTFTKLDTSTSYVFVMKPSKCLSIKISGSYTSLEGKLDFTKGGTQQFLKGDINGDDIISVMDLSVFAARYNLADLTINLNEDSIVGVQDLSIFAANYGKLGQAYVV